MAYDSYLKYLNKKNIFEPILHGEARNSSDKLDEFVDDNVSWALSGDYSSNKDSNFDSNQMHIELSRFFSPGASALEENVQPVRISVVQIPVSGIFIRTDEPCYILSYTLSGAGSVYLNGKKTKLVKGDGLFTDCQQYQEYLAHTQQGWRCVFVRMKGEVVKDLFHMLKRADCLQFSMSTYSRFYHIINRMVENAEQPQPGKEMLYSSYILALLTEIIVFTHTENHEYKTIPPVIHEMRYYIQSCYMKPITLDSLSERFHLSKYHLSREFKKYVHMGPNEFLIRVRLEKAKELLVSTNKSVEQISKEIGVLNTNHFRYLFQKHENMTPSSFRKYWK